MGVTLGTLKVEYDLCIISLREGGGISASEMYRLKTFRTQGLQRVDWPSHSASLVGERESLQG